MTRSYPFGLDATEFPGFRTDAEQRFVDELHRQTDSLGISLDGWYEPNKLMFSLSILADGALRSTYRIDYEAGVVTMGEDRSGQMTDDLHSGCAHYTRYGDGSPEELARAASAWLSERWAHHR